jgi:molybdate transport system regulatory protein
MAETQVSIRIDLETGGRIGPGKIALLEAIRETGSITAAACAMKMSYRRAWLLVDELNKLLNEPIVATAHGGAMGGGATLTPAAWQSLEVVRLGQQVGGHFSNAFGQALILAVFC